MDKLRTLAVLVVAGFLFLILHRHGESERETASGQTVRFKCEFQGVDRTLKASGPVIIREGGKIIEYSYKGQKYTLVNRVCSFGIATKNLVIE